MKLVSFSLRFYRVDGIPVHDVRLSRALSLIPMQVEILREALRRLSREKCLVSPVSSPYDPSTRLSAGPLYLFNAVSSKASTLFLLLLLPPLSPLSSLSQVVHSFLRLSRRPLPTPRRSYYPSFRRATLKLAFSLLSSEAADFPHFTFQSHEGCDFLPHFHSDNIEGASNGERRRKFHNFVDSIIEKRKTAGTNGKERARH